MREVATGGRTILFVSHNMQAVTVLCNRGIFLRGGLLEYSGSTKEAVDMYISSFGQTDSQDDDPDRRYGSGEYRFTSASADRQIFEGAEEKVINFQVQRRGKLVGRMWLSALIVDSSGVVVAQCDSRLIGFTVEDCPKISGQLRFTTPWLKPGSYRVNLCVGAPWAMDYWEGACSLNISPVLPYPHPSVADASHHGVVYADFSWEASEVEKESAYCAIQNNENSKTSKIGHPALEV